MSREEAQAVGVKIAVDIVEKLRNVADGYYFMVPFNRAEMIAEICFHTIDRPLSSSIHENNI